MTNIDAEGLARQHRRRALARYEWWRAKHVRWASIGIAAFAGVGIVLAILVADLTLIAGLLVVAVVHLWIAQQASIHREMTSASLLQMKGASPAAAVDVPLARE